MASLILIAIAVFRTAELSGQLLMLTGILMFGGFCWFQSKRRDPLLQVTLFRDNSVFATLGITHLLSYSGLLALPFAATLYLQYLKAIDPQTTGLILLVQALFTAMIAPAGGWLIERVRVQSILIFGMLMLLIGMAIFAFLDTQSPIWKVGLALSLIGAAVGLVDTQLLRVSLASVEDRLLGSASATLNGLRTVGGFIGIGIISYLMGSTIGKQEITPAIYPELMNVLNSFFIIASILTFCALALLTTAIVLRNRKRAQAST
jgi:MFS family permease